MQGDWSYVAIWEFRVRPGSEAEFERVYGDAGVWAEFFRGGAGFVKTELIHDTVARRYLTLDFWASQKEYDEFRQMNAERYQAIDAQCEVMTESEVEIGRFSRVDLTGI